LAVRTIQTVPTDLPHAKLYLDDLEEVTKILMEMSVPESEKDEPIVTYKIGNKVMDSISDLHQQGGSTTSLEVNVRRRRWRDAELRFSNYSDPSVSFVSEETQQKWALYGKVKTVFDSKRYVLKNVVDDLPEWVKTSFYTVNLIIPFAFAGLMEKGWKAFGVMFLAYYLVLGILLTQIAKRSRVVLSYSYEHAKLSAEARRSYIRDIVMVALGAGITKTVELFISKLTK